MTISRPWPRSPDGAIHLIGDTHFGSPQMSGDSQRRAKAWAQDLGSGMLPESTVHVVVGDLTDTSDTDEDAEAIAFMDAAYGAGKWISAVGNHDVLGRTPDQAANAWGMPGANSSHDYGFCRIIRVMSDGVENDGVTMQPLSSDRLNWLDAQLQAAGDTPCLIVCHWSLYDTVQAGYASYPSTASGWYALADDDIRTVLADNDNAVGWLSGHTHSTLDLEGIVTSVELGAHTLCAVNASSPAYVADWDSRSVITTMYLTVTDGQIDVRFRDHGAGIWTHASPARLPKISVPTTSFTPATGFGTSPFGTSLFGA